MGPIVPTLSYHSIFRTNGLCTLITTWFTVAIVDGIPSLRQHHCFVIARYTGGTLACSLACSPDGAGFVSGHVDGKVFRFYFDDGSGSQSQGLLCKHSCAPYGLVWAQDVIACGPNKKGTFHTVCSVYHLSARMAALCFVACIPVRC